MALDQDTFLKVLELVAVSAASVSGGVIVGHKRASKDSGSEDRDREFAQESARDLVQRAEERMKEYHAIRQEMNTQFGRVAVEHAKLEGRIEQSEKTSGRLEVMVREGFSAVNARLDAAIRAAARAADQHRRSGDGDGDREG